MTQKNKNLIPRAPIVVVMGHIDHGKTKLLDTIRKTNIVEQEAGGITQHIGAYEIVYSPRANLENEQVDKEKILSGLDQDVFETTGGRKITFIDTPGHEAFVKMRSRGAKVADIAILVIAADEGVKPQTEESIKIIQEAKIPFIVAINKIDKPEANSERVKQQLANLGIFLEGWGGNIPFVEISAKFNKGINNLLELILLVAELENLKGDLEKPASGVVIESYLDPKRGYVATLLIRDGKLRVGDYIVVGNQFAKVKLMEDFLGKRIESAYFSSPVLVIGFEKMPDVGEEFLSTKDKKEAEELLRQINVLKNASVKEADVDKDYQEKIKGKKLLNLILKTDVFGSKEALDKIIKDNLVYKEVAVNLIKSEVGDVNDSDIKLSRSTKSIIVAFRVKIPRSIELLAKQYNIKIITSEVIYDLIDKIKSDLKKLLEPEVVRYNLGKLNVLAIFKTEKNRIICGGKVINGEIQKGALAEVWRGNQKIIYGKIAQLQHNKQDVESVKQGLECGILFSYSEKDLLIPGSIIKVGDILNIYREERKEKELE